MRKKIALQGGVVPQGVTAGGVVPPGGVDCMGGVVPRKKKSRKNLDFFALIDL